MPLNFLSITSNFKLLWSSWCKSSGWTKSFTFDPIGKGLLKLPVIVPRSLMTQPDLLLLDEPLSNVDQSFKEEIQVRLKKNS